jgi:glycosyltransferase involved in cell wall biosynthesis
MADGGVPDTTRTLRVLALGVNWFGAGSGGLDRVFRDLALGLPDAHVALRGLVLGPAEAGALTQGRVRAFGRGGGLYARLFAARQAVAEALREERTDVVAAHFALFAAPALDLLGRQPFVMHFHGPWADEAAEEGAGRFGCAVRWRLERSVYRRATRVITLSRAFAELLHTRYGVPAERISVIPGSVDLARFAPAMSRDAARAALGWPIGRPVILAVRRLVRRMGLDRLVEAMPAVRDAVPGAMLMIAGRGAEAMALKDLAQRCGVAEHVRFLGFLAESDLPAAYRAADINVVPSRALEGFGLAAAEALAAGTPSLVAPVGGLPEVVAPLSQKLVLRSGASADIASGLIAALRGDRPGEAACLRYARERFCARRVVMETAQLYREVAGVLAERE